MKKALISLLLCAAAGLSLAASPVLQCDDESTVVKVNTKQVKTRSLSEVQLKGTSVSLDRSQSVVSDPQPLQPGPHGKTTPFPGVGNKLMSPKKVPTLRIDRIGRLDKRVGLNKTAILEKMWNTLEPDGVGRQPRPIKPGKPTSGSGSTIRESLADALQQALFDGTVKRTDPLQAPQVKSGTDLRPTLRPDRISQVVNDPQPIEPGNHPHGGGGNLLELVSE